MRYIFLILISAFTFNIAVAADDLPNFQEINLQIFRSGHPTENGILKLKNTRGIKTIINLEDKQPNINNEYAIAKKMGLEYFSYPMSSYLRPNDLTVNKILALLKDQTRYPILIHCLHGEDRTGLIIGLHRVFAEGWAANNAYNEMLNLGFHQILIGLDSYYKDKTGLKFMMSAN